MHAGNIVGGLCLPPFHSSLSSSSSPPPLPSSLPSSLRPSPPPFVPPLLPFLPSSPPLPLRILEGPGPPSQNIRWASAPPPPPAPLIPTPLQTMHYAGLRVCHAGFANPFPTRGSRSTCNPRKRLTAHLHAHVRHSCYCTFTCT